ncbi:MAG TPA: right-handed parallel beta-helix repeat-containing protein, partial [Acidobacteriota bacterium]|nr:right-handed parallel beta-helix repeat-containing protein [Acidobacteriota bacterium]
MLNRLYNKLVMVALIGVTILAIAVPGRAQVPFPQDNPHPQSRIARLESSGDSMAALPLQAALEQYPGSMLDRVWALKADRSALAGRSGILSARTEEGRPPERATVDCTKGDSIQEAVDKSKGPVVIEVRGICRENVRIEGKQVTLRGQDPASDGIEGVPADPSSPAIEIFFADGVRIENLSVSNGPAIGIGLWFTHAEMENLRIESNGLIGLHVSSGSFLFGLGLTISNNASHGLHAQRTSLVFCDACELEDNAGWAGFSGTGALLTLRDSVISGERGLVSAGVAGHSYIDIDCLTAGTGHPCSLTANQAARAAGTATAALWVIDDFTGQLSASDRAHLFLIGSRQLSTGLTPGGDPRLNFLTDFATLRTVPYNDGLQFHESLIKGDFLISTFCRAILSSETVVDGNLTCEQGGDAWASSGVVLTPGSSISNCQHAPSPAP